MAVSSARRRSSSRASLLLDGEPSRDDDDARESCSRSEEEREARRRAANSANAERMLIMSVDSSSELSLRTARDATECSFPAWEGAASNTSVVSVSRSRTWNCLTMKPKEWGQTCLNDHGPRMRGTYSAK